MSNQSELSEEVQKAIDDLDECSESSHLFVQGVIQKQQQRIEELEAELRRKEQG